MCAPGAAGQMYFTHTEWLVTGATVQEAALPIPGPTLGTSALPWAPPSNCSTGQAGSPIAIATAAHELLGGGVLAGRWRAPQGNLVTGRRHKFSNT